jgi:hypothetical protein
MKYIIQEPDFIASTSHYYLRQICQLFDLTEKHHSIVFNPVFNDNSKMGSAIIVALVS